MKTNHPDWGEIDSIEKDRIDKEVLARDKEALKSHPPRDHECSKLEHIPEELSDRLTQLVLRDFDLECLLKALAGASGLVLLHFIQFMGDRGQILFLQDLRERRKASYTSQEIASAQESVLGFIRSIK
tara:strand:+ start:946 stop:1329 length:384 start_codon:yes stop_codon:yes gene_type:complete